MANEILAENIAFDENGLYIPQTWLDGVGEENFTPMTADRMNHIEQGIKGLSDAWDSQCQLLWSGISDRYANPLTIDVSGIESACILGVRMHDSNYPIIVCPVDKNGRFFGSAFHRTSDSNRYLFLSGRIDKDSVIFDAHLYDSYTIPELGYWPLRNAGDSLSVVEIYRLM